MEHHLADEVCSFYPDACNLKSATESEKLKGTYCHFSLLNASDLTDHTSAEGTIALGMVRSLMEAVQAADRRIARRASKALASSRSAE